MRKSKHLFGGAVFFVLMLFVLFFYPQPFGVERETSGQLFQISKEEEKALNDFQEYLYAEGGFFEQVGVGMEKAGYDDFSIAAMLYTTDDIRLDIILHNIREVTEHHQKEITQILYDMMIKYHIDQKAFTIQVSSTNSS
ncbi:hypothetical protein [Psychrobacillus sp. OK032]|uniref:hypothetical protein n=1 Tax=Psychrobacillus sp. OK032 TaxID=1884358 RepID=UPI0008D10115|nr:hypothetical protein [Psychrobacillus sp. OK032]SER79266.1 hypothetical protein SAMN05518872_10264 [Psychrobacillus sp. OK032]